MGSLGQGRKKMIKVRGAQRQEAKAQAAARGVRDMPFPSWAFLIANYRYLDFVL